VTDIAPGAVTVADLYRELVGMRTDLVHVLATQEATTARNHTTDMIHADHETRLRTLERFRFTLGGLSIVGGAVAGWIGYVLGHTVH
jgi:hypothetical protein